MGEINLFRVANKVEELISSSFAYEKDLQKLVENNMESILAIRFLATEYTTSEDENQRIDSLGLDENNCPVIIEYKREKNQNIISQGLSYMNWLLNHKAEFEKLANKKLGKEAAENIEWKSVRLLCIASGFSRHDTDAIKQIDRNIELIKYIKYGEKLLLFEQVNKKTIPQNSPKKKKTPQQAESSNNKDKAKYRTITMAIESADEELNDRYCRIRDFIINLGDDVEEKQLKFYMAYVRMKNFVCLDVHTRTRNIMLYLKVDPSKVQLEEGFSRDVTNTGHWGTGNLELNISNMDDFEKAKELIIRSYENS